MSYKSVLTKIDELRAIVGSWRDDADPALLEMDMALERVKTIYEMLRFPVDEPVSQTEVVVESESMVEPAHIETIVEEQMEEVDMAETEAVEIEPTPEPEPESTPEPEPTPEPILIAETEPEPIVEQVSEEDLLLELVNVTQVLDGVHEEEMIDKASFDREIAAMAEKKRERLNKILSLYSDSDESEIEIESESEEQVVEESVVESQQIEETETEVAEEQQEGVEVAVEPQIEQPDEPQIEEAELTHKDESVEASQPAVRVPISLGINDRILLLQELFDGDDAEMQRVIGILEELPTIDDAMIYIAENHSWSGDNEGAQLLMSLLQSRYQI